MNYNVSWWRSLRLSSVVLLHTCLQPLRSSQEQSCPAKSEAGVLEYSRSTPPGPWIWSGWGCTHFLHCFVRHRLGPESSERIEIKNEGVTWPKLTYRPTWIYVRWKKNVRYFKSTNKKGYHSSDFSWKFDIFDFICHTLVCVGWGSLKCPRWRHLVSCLISQKLIGF